MNTYRTLIQPLAAEPPVELPPELLPLESDSPWSIENTARRALGLLAAGEQPGPRLFAYADYLLTFITVFERWLPSPDTVLLNGTALALIGYLSEGRHPEAELWRLVGGARLATAAHERKAALEDGALAACLQAVCELADQLNAPLLADLISLRERMWGRLLDHSRAERLHVSADDYPRHMLSPVRPEEVGALMRSRPWLAAGREPEYLLPPDLQEAEDTCRNLLTFRAHMLIRHQFGSEIDWHLRLFDDIESTVSINAQFSISNLAAAYIKTGDEKYARHAARLTWSHYNQCPVPNHKQYQGPWRTLEVGARPWRIWPNTLGWLGQTEAFDEATHAMLARSRLEHIRYLLAYCGGPNNWYQVEASGLATAALYSPDLRQAEAALRIGLRRLKWINSFAYYDDGFQFELTQGYHMFPTLAIFGVVRAAKARGVRLPADFSGLVEKAHEMYLFSAQPDGLLPTFNDCNPNLMDPATTLLSAAEIFERPDLRWGGTRGLEGTAPNHTSHAWPSAQLYAMRDRWGADGQFLFFDGAAWGASHQHEDKLSFVIYSHGRLLLGDPNIYSYANTAITHYFKSSRAHNLVLIDGLGQARRFDVGARLKTLGRNEWVSQPGFDFVSSEYLEGYAPDPFPSRGEAAQVDRRFAQRRAIFYVKPGYWILCDRMTGPADGEHTLEQLFHFAPIVQPESSEPVQAGEVEVSPQLARTANPGLGNLAVIPVDPQGLQARAVKGQTNPAAGWYGVLGEYPAWEVTFEAHMRLPARLDAVLYPQAPGSAALPTLRRIRADELVTAFAIEIDGQQDLFILCEEEAGEVEVEGVTFAGRALLLRRGPTPTAYAVSARTLRVNGKEM